MRILYLDARSGISGDMFLAALLDLGVDVRSISSELSKLPLTGYQLHAQRTEQSAIRGMKCDVLLSHEDHKDQGFTEEVVGKVCNTVRENMPERCEQSHETAKPSIYQEHPYLVEGPRSHTHGRARHYAQIRQMIEESELVPKVKRHALRAFKEIAEAEAVIHGVPVDQVHFHEVGAMDSIIDIVGSCIGLNLLQVDKVICSALEDGTGFIQVAHGKMPVPVPAVMQMRVGTTIPVRQRDDVHTELITPTGMALVKTFVSEFGPVPSSLCIERVGYGFGTRHTGGLNALRVLVGSVKEDTPTPQDDSGQCALSKGTCAQEVSPIEDSVVELSANIDDQTSESLAPVLDLLLEAGALDAYFLPLYMKKNRPAVQLVVIARVRDKNHIVNMVLKHTSTAGIRINLVNRVVMQRHFSRVETPVGSVRIKHLSYDGIEKSKPEFEDCKRIAQANGLSMQEVYELVYRSLKD